MTNKTMMRLTRVSVLGFLLLMLLFLSGNVYAAAGPQHINAGSFRMLDQHGEWIQDAKFGRVWRPHVVTGWRPFLYGDWITANNALYWDSYEPFGWLVYHYGNWYNVNGEGWIWIPGYDWSSAQVQWLDYDGYIGWAPLPPAGYFWPDPWDMGPVLCWNVVKSHDFHQHEIDRHIVHASNLHRPEGVDRIVRKAPDSGRIATVGHTKVEKLTLNHAPLHDGDHVFKQPQFPKEHLQRTAAFRDRVNRQILMPPHKH